MLSGSLAGTPSDVFGVSGTDSAAPPPQQAPVSNRDVRPVLKTSPRAGFPPDPVPDQDEVLTASSTSPPSLDTSDPTAGGGRGFWYSWELEDQQIREDMEDIAIGGVPSYTHHQDVPAATWVINHHMGLMPNVLLTDLNGNQLMAEIQYPDDQTVVVVHSAPYSGTAYLRP